MLFRKLLQGKGHFLIIGLITLLVFVSMPLVMDCSSTLTTDSKGHDTRTTQTSGSTSKTLASSEINVTPTQQETTAGTFWITYENDCFVPDSVIVPAGTKIIWVVSEDYNSVHWVVCEAISLLGSLAEWYPLEYIFQEPGAYHYFDQTNPLATGVINVY
jgi:plastocyanin